MFTMPPTRCPLCNRRRTTTKSRISTVNYKKTGPKLQRVSDIRKPETIELSLFFLSCYLLILFCVHSHLNLRQIKSFRAAGEHQIPRQTLENLRPAKKCEKNANAYFSVVAFSRWRVFSFFRISALAESRRFAADSVSRILRVDVCISEYRVLVSDRFALWH